MSKTAIVTGSNSGLGLDTCRQLGLRDDYGTIYMAVRTQEKGEIAKKTLIEKHGISENKLKIFVIDVSSIKNSKDATQLFIKDNPNIKIDAIICNAGRVGGSKLEHTEDGYNVVYAASLFGHYILTSSLVTNSLMNNNSTIIFIGSELSRGQMLGGMSVPMITLNIKEFAQKHFENDINKALICCIKGDKPIKYNDMGCYGDTKVLSNWLTGAFARNNKIKEQHIKIFCVSPGNTSGTNAPNNLSGIKRAMMPVMLFFSNLFGSQHKLEDGTKRYIDAIDFDEKDSGKFFASKDKKFIGPMVDNNAFVPIFNDIQLQDATLKVLSDITDHKFE